MKMMLTILSAMLTVSTAIASNTVCLDESKSKLQVTLEGLDINKTILPGTVPVSILDLQQNQHIGRSDLLTIGRGGIENKANTYGILGRIDDLIANKKRSVFFNLVPNRTNGKQLEIIILHYDSSLADYQPQFLNCEVVK